MTGPARNPAGRKRGNNTQAVRTLRMVWHALHRPATAPPLRVPELAAQFGVTERTVRRDIGAAATAGIPVGVISNYVVRTQNAVDMDIATAARDGAMHRLAVAARLAAADRQVFHPTKGHRHAS